MKNRGGLFYFHTLTAGFGLMLTSIGTAQTFTLLHTFTSASGSNVTNSDGANPSAGLGLLDNILYGTTEYGGGSGWGTVFAVSVNDSSFRTLHNFTGGNDGANPSADLSLSNNSLYGTAQAGGISGWGTIFAINTNGTDFTLLHSFTAPANNSFGFQTNFDGANPSASLFLSGDTLYGAANDGGSSGHGTVFAVNIHGTNFVTLHSFTTGSGGTYSSAGLVLLGNSLYGTDYRSLGNGTVFAVNIDGTSFTNYYAFTSGNLNGNHVLTNSDGANPYAKLVLSGSTLYGTTEHGGNSGNGTVFAINTDGGGFTTLHNFTTGAYDALGLYTNSDGINPSAGLILSGKSLYGTANAGGSSGHGSVFMVNTDGLGFTNIYNFTATPRYPLPQTNSDGANPYSGLILSGNSLYGTTAYGGSSGNGTVFSLSFAPQLTIRPSGTNIILTWPAAIAGFDYTGFILQSAPTITDTFTNIPGSTSPYIHPIAGFQQFYRLIQ